MKDRSDEDEDDVDEPLSMLLDGCDAWLLFILVLLVPSADSARSGKVNISCFGFNLLARNPD